MTGIETPIQERHPCFFAESRGKYGRIHLPVAPSCNIECLYCRRDYDCANENRPGVTSDVLTPQGGLERFRRVLAEMPNICVAGIAGPGDAFCHPEATLETFALIRKQFPGISFCVSSNGLNIKPFVRDLHELGVRFVTITVNAIDPGIGSLLVRRASLNGKKYTGKAASSLLIEQQMSAIEGLKSLGFTVKVNTVVVPGINDDHCPFIAKNMASLGVDLMNLLPLIPVEGTALSHVSAPSDRQVKQLRKVAGGYLPQMHHCKRCRSDAVGCL